MLEGSHDTRALAEVGRRQHGSTIESDKVKIVSGTGAQGGSVPGGEVPKYYRRVSVPGVYVHRQKAAFYVKTTTSFSRNEVTNKILSGTLFNGYFL